MMNYGTITSLELAPLIPIVWIGLLMGVAALLCAAAWWLRIGGSLMRILAFGLLSIYLLKPVMTQEKRDPLQDVAIVIVDKTDSQKIGGREDDVSKTHQEIHNRLSEFENLEIITSYVQNPKAGSGAEDIGTALFENLKETLKSVDRGRVAATFLVTDGQIHDIPKTTSDIFDNTGPIHTALTGTRNQTDRVLELIAPPTFALVGKPITLRFKVTDYPNPSEARATVVSIEVDGEIVRQMAVRNGEVSEVDIKLPHAGANHIVLRAVEKENEISKLNNLAVAQINAVRDRLKVLLVSGEPHMGERGWRNILKSDPSVDLVHFTILRPPEKQDATPLNELSLIPFPIVELFERKLSDFDLIVFDRYRKRGVLTDRYLDNIVNYVADGGALLEAAGPSFATPLSLYRTPLANILPGAPTGAILEARYTPKLSDPGKRHPVTGRLTSSKNSQDNWGPWFRLIDVRNRNGTVLMTGADEKPLLILNRFGKGRVAQLASDHAWLWGHGFEGGGPQSELFRRIAHWLMKEPDLEEEKLTVTRVGGALKIERQSMEDTARSVTVDYPDGTRETAPFSSYKEGKASASAPVKGIGLYQLNSGGLRTMVAIGNLSPKENRKIRTTDELIFPISEVTGGGMIWASEEALPSLRYMSSATNYTGRGWWGLRQNNAFEISGYTRDTLFPAWFVLLILVGLLMTIWYRESR
ncbi:hypothetical protein GUA87_01670 [Sneathiella sp. P13V-1]|uniref:hypothetical protein n=1 Tax=Sneathiella sp. P13V-1 TaxID=2697366 RepID=UPI00187B3173|nr:hypothetical protein [Sneathiella sp. P13V-1]MBE7635536.1 hypothetical protein [Sneathiella sp. P13V-1]